MLAFAVCIRNLHLVTRSSTRTHWRSAKNLRALPSIKLKLMSHPFLYYICFWLGWIGFTKHSPTFGVTLNPMNYNWTEVNFSPVLIVFVFVVLIVLCCCIFSFLCVVYVCVVQMRKSVYKIGKFCVWLSPLVCLLPMVSRDYSIKF